VARRAPNLPGIVAARLEEVQLQSLQMAGLLSTTVCAVLALLSLTLWLGGVYLYARAVLEVLLMGAGSGILLYLAARARHARLAYVLTVAMVCVPSTALWTFGGFAWDGRMAALLGAWPLAYAYSVVLTGMLLRPWVSLLAGALAAAQLLCGYLYVRAELEQLQLPARVMFDLVQPETWAIRSTILLVTGAFTAAIARLAQRLIRASADEQLEREALEWLFGQYVSPAVRDELLRTQAQTRVEQRPATVLVCDLRGFTRWSERTSAEAVLTRLNRYFEVMVGVVEREGGVVTRFLGDACVAVFGGMLSHPQPQVAALRAAVGMQEALGQLNAEWAREGEELFRSGVGLSHGFVVQGPIGGGRRREFALLGEPVLLAAQLEQETKRHPFAILCDAAVASAATAESGLVAVEIGNVLLPDRVQPVTCFGVRVRRESA
jgi:class 3 adenylate cyclase